MGIVFTVVAIELPLAGGDGAAMTMGVDVADGTFLEIVGIDVARGTEGFVGVGGANGSEA